MKGKRKILNRIMYFIFKNLNSCYSWGNLDGEYSYINQN